MLNPSTDVLPVFDHSSEVDGTANRGILAVDDRISIWSLLLQYICAGEKGFLRDHIKFKHLHWLS